jgi:IS30 family transposase
LKAKTSLHSYAKSTTANSAEVFPNDVRRTVDGKRFEYIKIEHVQALKNKLNNRPRKRFGYKTPNQVCLHKLTNQERVAFMP